MTNRLLLHSIQAFIGKGKQQKFARRRFVDAARAKIEESRVFELTDGCAMRSLHIVGVNLELRLGVDLPVVREQQVAIGLLGIGLLRVLVDDDPAVENAMRMIVEDAIVELPAVAMRLRVLN